MVHVQFRIHPSVGMARMGKSPDWYFLGPEIPRFIQERFPNLRQQPVALRHPNGSAAAAVPEANSYRDKKKLNPADKFGATMPQAARFRVFAYFYKPGIAPPYKVLELKPEHADIEWTVTLANQKGVNAAGTAVDPNKPPARTVSTKTSTPHQQFKSGSKPNLGWMTLEKTSSGTPSGRLHVIGNEGDATAGPSHAPPTSFRRIDGSAYLYQNDWQDTAADGPVEAVVELKPNAPAFDGMTFLVPGTADPVSLPADRKIKAVSAWAVVNMPDYIPDVSHFVSMWDLALNQAWQQIFNGNVRPIVGRHKLVTAAGAAGQYAFYDYYTHIHPQLGLFDDVAHASGQVRAVSRNEPGLEESIVFKTRLSGSVANGAVAITIDKDIALRLKVASLGAPFEVTLSDNAAHPLEPPNKHEFVTCSAVAESTGVLAITPVTQAGGWPAATTHIFASCKAGSFDEAKVAIDFPPGITQLQVDLQSALRMPRPTPAGTHERDKPFKLALTKGPAIEWLLCSKVEEISISGKLFGRLTVARAIDGTSDQDWKTDAKVIAPATGHKHLNARSRTKTLYEKQGDLHSMIFSRLRKPPTLYERINMKKLATLPNGTTENPHPFPRRFGRRKDILTVEAGPDYIGYVSIYPGGSVARYREYFAHLSGSACEGKAKPNPGVSLPAELVLPGEKYDPPPRSAAKREEHARQLDDFYWIATERDMPLLKELAFTHIQYNQFEYWKTGTVSAGHKPRWVTLFETVFEDKSFASYFTEAPGHTREEYIDKLFTFRPRYAPTFLDMASLGRMLGGSFLPGIEVGREGGVPANWSLYEGGAPHFPDVRFQPNPNINLPANRAIPLDQALPEPGPHLPGILTKDLAVPWFVDYIACDETFWPTSRPSIVQQQHGPAYQWIDIDSSSDAALIDYWTRLGFIRRQANDVFYETETLFPRP